MVVVAATIAMKGNCGKWWPEKQTMHIINDFGFELIVHCKSRDDDLGAQVVDVGSEYNWRFTGFGVTFFQCDVAVQDKRAHFVAFDGHGYCALHWVVNDDGIYANEAGCEPTHIPWPKF
ncbi:hypothetical protein LINPERHAP1_LOCUS24234 [Linum perenne]